MTTPRPPVRYAGFPDRMLEAYLCGELSPEDRARVEEAARARPALALHLEARRREKTDFSARRPFTLMQPKLVRSTPVWRRALRWQTLAVALPVAAALALAFGSTVPSPTPGAPDTVRVRGGVQVRLLVKRGEVVHEHVPGMALRPGDALRIEVADVHGGDLWVLGLDDRGSVTRLHGFADTGGPVHMEPGTLLLPGSVTLDAAPTQEALYIVIGESGLEDHAVEDWLSSAANGGSFPAYPEALPGTRYLVLPLMKERG